MVSRVRNCSWLVANGLSHRVSFDDAGGPIVVFIHEMGGMMESWDAVFPNIQPPYSPFLYDQRGAGLSQKMHQPFTVDDLAQDLLGLLDAAQLVRPVVLVGVAMGGATALTFAAKYPSRVAAVLAIVPTLGAPDADRSAADALAESIESQGMQAISAFSKSYPEPFRARNPQAFEQFSKRALSNDPLSYAQHFRAAARVDLEPLYARIECPSWIAAGTHDLRSIEQFESVCSRIPGGAFRVIETGHYANSQAPEAVGLLISEVLWNIEACIS